MGRKRQSGILETLVKSLFRTGTTVRYKTNWLGRKQKVVKHHDTGKKKTYTHGTGFFGNTTKTKTTKGWRTVETGKVRENTFFSGATEKAKKADGTRVTRKYKPGFLRDHITTTNQGSCFACHGTGKFVQNCPTCKGTGVYRLDEKRCHPCNGTGFLHGKPCGKCRGTGIFKPALSLQCKRCDGVGHYTSGCKKCEGTGRYYRRESKGFFS